MRRFLYFVSAACAVSMVTSACSGGSTEVGTGGSTTVLEETTATSQVDDDSPSVDEFTTDWDCGYGFYTSDDDQTWSLALELVDRGSTASASPDIGGGFELPSDEWTVTLTHGTDLYANWCDDVIEPGEPESEITETWHVRSGTVRIDIGEDGNRSTAATASISDLVVIAPWDEVVELGDVSIRNDCFGCLAG